MWWPAEHVTPLINLPSSDNELTGEMFFPDLPSFFNPALQPNKLDPTKIVDFYVFFAKSMPPYFNAP